MLMLCCSCGCEPPGDNEELPSRWCNECVDPKNNKLFRLRRRCIGMAHLRQVIQNSCRCWGCGEDISRAHIIDGGNFGSGSGTQYNCMIQLLVSLCNPEPSDGLNPEPDLHSDHTVRVIVLNCNMWVQKKVPPAIGMYHRNIQSPHNYNSIQ